MGAVIPAATDADTSDDLAYSIEGTDAASFNFNATTRQITTKTGVDYDFEAKPAYSVTIKVEDGNGGSDTVAVTINLTDVNEPPSAPAAPTLTSKTHTSLTVGWTAPANTGKPDITSYDVRYRRPSVSSTFTDGPQDQTGTSATITNLGPSTNYQVQVRATNAEGNGPWSDSLSTRTNANRRPTFAVTTATRSIAENTAANTNVGAVLPAATDADSDP